MAAVSLFWNTNMAAVTSCENTLLGYPASVINPSTVFSTFDVDKLVKIQGHHWKKHLKISELATFESDKYVLGERRYNAAKLGKFTYVCILGSNFALLPPLPNIQTSVNYRNFGELNLRQLSKNNFQTWRFC